MFLKKPKDKLLQLFRALGFREQLTLLLLAVLGTTLLLYSVVLYRNFIRIHETEFDTALYNYTVDVANALDINVFGEAIVSDEVFKANDKIFPFALDKTLLELRTIEGKTVAKSRELGAQNILITAREREELPHHKVLFKTEELILAGNPTNYRVATYFIDRPGTFAFALSVASPMILLEHERRGLLAFFLLSIPATLVIAAFGGYYFSAQATAPINDIIKKARAISAKKLSERLPVPPVKDEIFELAQTLNALLDRLQSAFESQEAFIADASHQIKTPLAILQGEIDLMRREKRSDQEIQEFFTSAHQEVGYLTRIVEELLILARVESGNQILFKPTRVDELAIEVVSHMQKHAVLKARGLKLEFNIRGNDHADFLVNGDFDLIRTLMENLVDNALKYTREKTIVAVEIEDTGTQVFFWVRDQGEGFSAEQGQRLFNRFYRNSRVEGSGLGLSIVKKIGDLHGAQIKAQSEIGGGSIFEAIFPKPPV